MPWSFSWGQCRLTLPGWYGFGSAIEQFLAAAGSAAARKERQALLQRMYAQWPFFRTLLSNMDMVLAKSDLALASRYAELVADRKLRQKVFSMIEAEWHRTSDALALITGAKQRLEGNADMQRSIRHRFPYIDPLHHLQVELMRRYRAGQGRRARCSAASTCRSTASRRACATPADRARDARVYAASYANIRRSRN